MIKLKMAKFDVQNMWAKRRGSTKQASLRNWPGTGVKPGQIQEAD